MAGTRRDRTGYELEALFLGVVLGFALGAIFGAWLA